MASLYHPDLIACRQVNHIFSSLSSSTLLKQNSCAIEFRFDEESKNYYKFSNPTSSHPRQNPNRPNLQFPLENLNKLLHSRPFPCTAFHFVGPLCEQPIYEFFHCHGLHIKSLTLDVLDLSITALCSKILCNTSNLAFLSLRMVETRPNSEAEDEKEFELHLPLLKSYASSRHSNHVFTSFNTFLLKLSSIASNPVILDGIDNTPLIFLIENGHGHRVKSLRIHRGFRRKNVDPFMDPSVHLERLEFNLYSPAPWIHWDDDIVEALVEPYTKLLKHHSVSLQFLRLGEAYNLFQFSSFPPFPFLKELKLQRAEMVCDNKRLFPPQTDLLKIFPALNILDVAWVDFSKDDLWYDYFPKSTNPDYVIGFFPTVKTLKILATTSKVNHQRLRKLCPGVKKLVCMGSGEDFLTFFGLLFEIWSTILNAVEINVFYAKRAVDFNLDSVLTGISKSKCKQLKYSEKKEGKKESGELSLCSMAVLKKLKFIISEPIPKYCQVPFTWVSREFAFRRMSNLEVSMDLNSHDYDDSGMRRMCERVVPGQNLYRLSPPGPKK